MSVVVRALATILLASVLALASCRGGRLVSEADPPGEPATGTPSECRRQDQGCGAFGH